MSDRPQKLPNLNDLNWQFNRTTNSNKVKRQTNPSNNPKLEKA
jgi:hypothetical protein